MLRNNPGITDPVEMDKAEAEALIKATDALFHEYDAEHTDYLVSTCQELITP